MGNGYRGKINLVNTLMRKNGQTFRVGVEDQTYVATNCSLGLESPHLIYGGTTGWKGDAPTKNGVATFLFQNCVLDGRIVGLKNPDQQVTIK